MESLADTGDTLDADPLDSLVSSGRETLYLISATMTDVTAHFGYLYAWVSSNLEALATFSYDAGWHASDHHPQRLTDPTDPALHSPTELVRSLIAYLMWLDGRVPGDWHDSERTVSYDGLFLFDVESLAAVTLPSCAGLPPKPWIARTWGFPLGSYHQWFGHRQVNNLFQYVRHHIVLSRNHAVPRTIRTPAVSRRIGALRTSGAIGLYPLATSLEFRPRQGGNRQSTCVHVADDSELVKLDEALSFCDQQEISILLLPELSVSSDGLHWLSSRLRQRSTEDSRRFPTLTIVGREHHAPTIQFRNTAFILDFKGRVLLEYHKRTSFFSAPDSDECHAIDTDPMNVLPSPLGLLAIAICRDLFDEPSASLVSSLHASALFVPSLSKKTYEHRNRSLTLGVDSHSCIFVCNRWFPFAQPHETSCGSPKTDDFFPIGSESFAFAPSERLSGLEPFATAKSGVPIVVRWPLRNER